MGYSMPSSGGGPSTLVRSTITATVDVAGRTLRACASVDPAAVVTALAALPALAEGVAQLVQRLAVVAERVEGVLDGVENTQLRVDRVVDDISATAGGVIGKIDSITGTAAGAISRVDEISRNAGGAIDRVDEVTSSAGEVIGRVDGVVISVHRTVDQANETIRASDVSVRRLTEVTETVTRMQPLLDNLTDLDPALGKDLVGMLRSLPGLMERVDARVVPAVS